MDAPPSEAFLAQLEQFEARLNGRKLWPVLSMGGNKLRFDEFAAPPSFNLSAPPPAAAAAAEETATPEWSDPFNPPPPAASAKPSTTEPPMQRAISAPAVLDTPAPLPPPSLAKTALDKDDPPPLPPPATFTPGTRPPSAVGRRAGLSDVWDDTKGWLVQRIYGLGNATVAKTGQPMMAHYDDAQKRWYVVFGYAAH
jgi:hypothetical protein